MKMVPISPGDPGSLRVLVVEDDADMSVFLQRAFESNPDYAATALPVTSMSEALIRLKDEELDAVLLDLGLPDSEGLRTVRTLLEHVAAGVAVVVLTGQRDQMLAAQSLGLGVQDYIVKEDATAALVTRVVRYAVTRSKMVEDLAAARRGEERERELRRLERMAADGARTSISAAMLGSGTVAERLGVRYEEEIVTEYRRIMDLALEEQAFRGISAVTEDLRSLASVLGYFGAGPRDVVELHSQCLREQIKELDPVRGSAAVEEGRVLVLQLMGRLVSYYRGRSMGTLRDKNQSSGGSPADDTKDGQ